MSKEENLFEDFSSRTTSTRRIIAFNLMYKGIEVEGTVTEHYNDLWSDWDQNWDQEFSIEPNDDLTDDDIDNIEDYVLENIK